MMTVISYQNYLHSTMYLLNPQAGIDIITELLYLHSTMYLLNLNI